MKSVYPPLFSREFPLFIEIQLFEQKEFLRKENKTELFQYIRLFIMVLHQYQYLLWYCNFAVHTPSSSYTFSVTAVLITAMNIKQTFKELQNCTAAAILKFLTLAKSSRLRRICNKFPSQLSISVDLPDSGRCR